MRKIVVLTLLIAGGTAAALAPHSSASPSASALRGSCATTTGLDIFFWPQGHDAVPAIGFPAFHQPHVEFFRGHQVADASQLAYMDAGRGLFASTCSAGADQAMAAIDAAAPTSVGPEKIRCTVTGNVDLRFAPLNRVTTRIVRKTITVKVRVRGKLVKRKKVVKRPVKTVTQIGFQGTAAAAGTNDTLVRIEMTAAPKIRWNTTICSQVPLTG